MTALEAAGARTPVLEPVARRAPPGPLIANARLIEREDLTPTIARFVVRPDGPVPAFVPGQYFAIGLPVDGRWLLRPYSTASLPPAEGGLEFLVRLVAGGALTPRLWRLRPGDGLRMGPPKGVFRLADGDPRAHLFVATGTGLAPFVSMAGALARRPGHPRATVVHGVARVGELAYRREFESPPAGRTGVSYIPAVSRPAEQGNAGWAGRTGRLDAVIADLLAEGRLDPADLVAFLCGNPAMIAAVAAVLDTAGVPRGAVISEHYWLPATAS